MRETVRKVARTVANVVQLMDTDDSLVYAMSSAQQWAWLEAAYPELFARVKEYVEQGRFVPAGGMWVESDTNLVGGEAMARQFVVGSGGSPSISASSRARSGCPTRSATRPRCPRSSAWPGCGGS